MPPTKDSWTTSRQLSPSASGDSPPPRRSGEVFGGHGALLAGAEEEGLVDDPDAVAVEAVAVAVRAHDGSARHDGLAALADLEGAGIGSDLAGLGKALSAAVLLHDLMKLAFSADSATQEGPGWSCGLGLQRLCSLAL